MREVSRQGSGLGRSLGVPSDASALSHSLFRYGEYKLRNLRDLHGSWLIVPTEASGTQVAAVMAMQTCVVVGRQR